MKKSLIRLIIPMLLIGFTFTSCGDDEYGDAVIKIDSVSDNDLNNETFLLKGTVKSESGSTLQIISIMALYRDGSVDDPQSDRNNNEKTQVLANIGDLRKKSKNEYEFNITRSNKHLSPIATTIYAIRINAKVQDGGRSSETWYVIPEKVPL